MEQRGMTHTSRETMLLSSRKNSGLRNIQMYIRNFYGDREQISVIYEFTQQEKWAHFKSTVRCDLSWNLSKDSIYKNAASCVVAAYYRWRWKFDRLLTNIDKWITNRCFQPDICTTYRIYNLRKYLARYCTVNRNLFDINTFQSRKRITL